MAEPLTPEEEKALRHSLDTSGALHNADIMRRLLATLDAERALHPVRGRIRATLRDIEALAEMVHPDPDHPGIGVRMVSWAAVRNRIDAALAEPVPVTAYGRVENCRDCDDAGGVCRIHALPVPATGKPLPDMNYERRDRMLDVAFDRHTDPLTGKDNPETWRRDPLTGEWH